MSIETQVKQKAETSKIFNNPILTIGIMTLVTMTMLDFYLHRNGGVSDPTTRKIYSDLFGAFFTSHIGNFGFASATSIPIVTTGKLADKFAKSYDRNDLSPYINAAEICALASFLTLVGLMEITTPFTQDSMGDIFFTILGALNSKYVVEELMHQMRLKRNERVRNKPDPFFKNHDIPSNVDQIGYLNDIPTTPNVYFS